MKYTLVQHSGYGYTGNPQFERAVEMRTITERQEAAVVRRGGLVFTDYRKAYDATDNENYPPEVTGLVPRARGMFSTFEIDGLRLYIPASEDKCVNPPKKD